MGNNYDEDSLTCFYCNQTATHWDELRKMHLCEDPQCLNEAYIGDDEPMLDLCDLIKERRN